MKEIRTESQVATTRDSEVRKSGFDFFALLFRTFLSPAKEGVLELRERDGTVHRLGRGEKTAAIVQVRHPRFYRRCILYGDVGLGESYMAGEWDTPSLKDVLSWFIRNGDSIPGVSTSQRKKGVNLLGFANRILHLLRDNTPSMSKKNIRSHYDLGNDFYSLWLDRTMTYSSASFLSPQESLHHAQIRKYEKICSKLRIQPHHHILEIGCGWGGFALYAAATYGCRITCITLSREQYDYTLQKVTETGLHDRITILLKDYRELEGRYDRIVSIEMVEALGFRHIPRFFRICENLLRPGGLLLIQCILMPDGVHPVYRRSSDWIQKHIFPGGLLLSLEHILTSLRKNGNLNLYDMESMGIHYGQTLRLWNRRFHEALGTIRKLGFDEHFIRKWRYYLELCEAGFLTRYTNAAQLLFSAHTNREVPDRIPLEPAR